MTYFRTIKATESGNRHSTHVGVFDGLHDLASRLDGFRWGNECFNHLGRAAEFNGRDWQSALEATRSGDLSYVAKSEALLASLENAVQIATPRKVQQTALVGSRLHVGNYLAGAPAIAIRRFTEPSDFAPLTVCVSTVCSAGNNRSELLSRGVAVLALLRSLTAVRPVKLYALSAIKPGGTDNLVSLIQVDTSPLHLATAAFMLCDTAFSRRIGWASSGLAGRTQGAREPHDGYIQWYDGADVEKAANAERRLVDTLFPNDEVLYVAPVSTHSAEGVLADPAGWVRKQLDEFGTPPSDD